MTRTDGRTELRAYQILNAAGKMVGKKVDARKMDSVTAYEIVQRASFFNKDVMVFAYRIVRATIDKNGKIVETELLQGGDELSLNQCTELVAAFRLFAKAPVKSADDTTSDNKDRWNGVLEVQFKADSDLDADEVYDAVWISSTHIEQRDGGIFIKLPEGMSFVGVNLPNDSVFIPE